jgi:hypothetical protein
MGGMRNALAAFLLLVTAAACTGCPHPGPGPVEPGPGKVISCGTAAIQACAPEALPAVNGCLAGAGDIVTCLVGLIKPTGCLTYEVISCLVRHEGSAAAKAASANPADTVDTRRAARAKEYIERQQIQFQD